MLHRMLNACQAFHVSSKSKNRRDCPAMGKPIASAECGAMRNSGVECPAHCPFNPFGTENYDAWLHIDGTWMAKVFNFMARHIPLEEFRGIVDKMRWGDKNDEESEVGALVAAAYYVLTRWRDTSGRTLADIWEACGWDGLNNDERVMMRYRRNSVAAIFEVHRVLDGQRIEMTDLLADEPKRFVVFDRSIAASVGRFERVATWLTHYPHFSRPLSGGVLISQLVYGDALKELRRRAVLSGLSPRDWLAENFSSFAAWIGSESRCRLSESVRNADVNRCLAVYQLKTSVAAIRAVLECKPELREGVPPGDANLPPPLFYYGWVCLGESKALERKLPAMFASSDDGTMIGNVGSLWVYENRIVVESMSRLRFGFARELIEKWLQNLIEFFQEGVVDLGGQFADKHDSERAEDAVSNTPASGLKVESWRIEGDENGPDGGEISPETEARIVTLAYRQHYERFLADGIPALDGMSPLDAARDMTMRPRLIELMKSHVSGVERQAMEKGIALNIDWVLQRLDLRELLD